MTPRKAPGRRRQTGPRILGRREAGFSMLEVLVAVAVMTIALLGLAVLQILGLRTSNSAYYRSQATVLAYDMAERMRANPANMGAYTMALADPPAPTDGTEATASKKEWKESVAATLPNGQGAVALTGAVATITVAWADNAQEAASTTQTYTYSTGL